MWMTMRPAFNIEAELLQLPAALALGAPVALAGTAQVVTHAHRGVSRGCLLDSATKLSEKV